MPKRSPHKQARSGATRHETGRHAGRRRSSAGIAPDDVFRVVADASSLLVWTADPAGNVTFVNAAWGRFTGHSAKELSGEGWFDFIHPADRERVVEAYRHAITTARHFDAQCRLRSADGDYQSVHMACSPQRAGTDLLGYLGTAAGSDLTAGSENGVYRTIFDNANDAIVVFEPRTERVLEANARALALYGFAREEFIGLSLKKLTMDIARGEQHVSQTLTNGSGSDFETVHFRKDGSPLTLLVNTSVIEFHGQPAILAINRDISRLLSVEEVLKNQDNILQRLLASSDDIVCMQDKDGRYLFYTGSPRFSLGAEEVRGQTPYDYYPAPVARKMMERLYQVIATGKSVSTELQLDWQGETYWFLDQLSPVRNSRGDVVSVVTISRNITERKKAEEKLRRSEERYRAFIEGSSDGIWRLEMMQPVPDSLPTIEQRAMILEHGYLAECNDVMAKMLGQRVPENLIGAPITVVLPRDSAISVDGLARFIEDGYRLSEVESREIDEDGGVHYFSNSFTGILEQGNLVRIWGNRRDITVRKQVEREMRLLAQTITSAKDCISITDLDGRILFVNDAYLSTYGYSEDDLLGKPQTVVRSPAGPRDAGRDILPAALRGGWYGEVLHRKKDGSDFPLELWMSVVRNDEGEPVALVSVARDITERRRMERALRQSEARLRRITDAIRDAVIQTDADGIVEYVSPSGSMVLGHTAEATLGRSFFDYVHEDDRARVGEVFRSALVDGRAEAVEFRYCHGSGHDVWLEAVGTILRDDEGRASGSVFAVRDIGERKQAEQQIRTSLREKEVMLKEIHHRVKNNLQVISSLLSLQSESLPDENIRKALRDSQNRVRSMAIIHQRLYQSTNLAEINFAGYIDELCSQLIRSYGPSAGSVAYGVKAQDVFFGVDQAIPCGIIVNELVSNALKYAFPDGRAGTVTVELTQSGREVFLGVSDDGIGMDTNIDLMTAESLGLRLVHMLVEQLGGTITVTSAKPESPDHRGTRWVVKFIR